MSHSPSWNPSQLSRAQDIRACAELLLELAEMPHSDSCLVLDRLQDLHQYSLQKSLHETYHPLLDLKQYFEQTVITYREHNYQSCSIAFGSAVSALCCLDQRISPPLLQAVMDHLKEEMKPSGPLYAKLKEVCQHR